MKRFYTFDSADQGGARICALLSITEQFRIRASNLSVQLNPANLKLLNKKCNLCESLKGLNGDAGTKEYSLRL